MIAAFLGPGKLQVFTQGVEQRRSRVEFQLATLSVHMERHRHHDRRNGPQILGLDSERNRGCRSGRGGQPQEFPSG